MTDTKVDIQKILSNVSTEINAVNKEIERTIQSEGLDNTQIETWIESLNQIIRKTDHAVEVLEESRN